MTFLESYMAGAGIVIAFNLTVLVFYWIIKDLRRRE